MTLLTISRAAVELNVSVRRMQQLVDEGYLSAVRCECGRTRMIDRSDLKAVRVRPKVGRPRKKAK